MGEKRNQYLDISDEEDIVSDSEPQERGRADQITYPSSKRRKLDSDADSTHSIAEDEESADDQIEATDTVEQPKNVTSSATRDVDSTKAAKTILRHSNSHQKKRKKTGVIYLSRIPPFMKPQALRNLLTPYGDLLRIFLTPEPSNLYLKRVKSGGNKKRSFIDGWIEFASKKKAKICAETLNGTIVGGKKSGWYHDDIWNIKYLRGFKWDDLMEQVQDEERQRQEKMRAAIKMEAKERKAFLDHVEQDKIEKTREAKRKKRGDTGNAELDQQEVEGSRRPVWMQKTIKQRDTKAVVELQDETRHVLQAIL